MVVPRTVRTYYLPDGGAPFEKWYSKLKDKKVRAAILTRIDRLRLGNSGDYKRLNENLYELRIHLGPGYRIYFAELEGNFLLLLLGGTKATQNEDINKAQSYWEEFRSRQP
jgi:putative addiction module killer protein